MGLPTVDDVARVAQVSRQTVSNVLNSPSIVRERTRQRVEAAIAELGYRPNSSARRLRQQKSGTLGIRLDPMRNGISGAVLDRFVHALTEHADRRQMRVLLFTADRPEDETEQIRRLHDAADVDAFVLTATFHGDPRTAALTAAGIPFVTFGRPWGTDDRNDPQHLWVDVDGHAGTRDATAHLVAQGARRVGWLGWPPPSGTGDDRRRGWEDAMRQQLGIASTELADLTMQSGDTVHEAAAAVRAALVQRDRPDAIVCASDTLALGALIAVSSTGSPDLPIVGFDNTPVAQALGLSSVEQSVDEVAAAALELLLGPAGDRVIGRPLTPGNAHRLIPPTLVVRRQTHLPVSALGEATTRTGPGARDHHRKET